MSQNILVVDDDDGVRSFVEDFLASRAYKVFTAPDGMKMHGILAKEDIDLLLLDLTLPGEDGIELTRKLRSNGFSRPIIMISGRGEVIDRVVGLETGADDYISKPFDPHELLARIRAALRRSPSRQEEIAQKNRAVFANFILDVPKRNLLNDKGEEIYLTAGEFDLLFSLVSSPERVIPREKLLDLVHGREMGPYDRSVDILVMRLRRKIETNPALPTLIKTARATGYMFAVPVRWE